MRFVHAACLFKGSGSTFLKCHIHLYYVKKLLLEFVDVIKFTPGASLLDLISKIMFCICFVAMSTGAVSYSNDGATAPPTFYLASPILVRCPGVSVFVCVTMVIFHVDLEK